MLECGFESRLGLEFSCFSMWLYLKLVVGSFLRVGIPVPPPPSPPPPPPKHTQPPTPSPVNVFNQHDKAEITVISALSNLIAELSLQM